MSGNEKIFGTKRGKGISNTNIPIVENVFIEIEELHTSISIRIKFIHK